MARRTRRQGDQRSLLPIILLLCAGCGDASLPPQILDDLGNPCANGVRNAHESDVDCGGSCPKCAIGRACLAPSDCESGSCPLGRCEPLPQCSNGVRDPSETDLDRGGACPGCGDGRACAHPPDCLSDSCREGICQPPTCKDGVSNGGETDLDCGGPKCARCASGRLCLADLDCILGTCVSSRCSSCSDLKRDGDETAVDCGGSWCPGCLPGRMCLVDTDCKDKLCQAGLCAPCIDGVKDGLESDLDCGGPSCPRCKQGSHCNQDSDCEANCVCLKGICAMPASCANKTKDGDETDVDCGGKFCVPCALGAKCKDASDCVTKGCSNGVCSTCADELLNGDETDTNCGGSCPPCPDAHVCKVDAECSTGGCVAGVCHLLPRCHDGKLNDDEVDVDCGGKTCLRCADGKKCKLGDDCLSGKCVNGTCGKFTCQCPMNPYGLHCRQDGTCACDGRSCDDCCEGHTKCGGYNGIDQLCGRYGKFCTQCGPIFSGCFHGIYRTYCWNQLGPLCKTGCCVGTWCYPSNTVEHCGGAICQTCKQGMMCQAGACK